MTLFNPRFEKYLAPSLPREFSFLPQLIRCSVGIYLTWIFAPFISIYPNRKAEIMSASENSRGRTRPDEDDSSEDEEAKSPPF